MAPLISVAVASNGISCSGSRSERSAKKRCLADAMLCDEGRASAGLALQRVDDDLHELAAPAGKEGLWVVVWALKDAADVAQELEIDRAPAPLLQVATEVLAQVRLDSDR